MVRNTTVLTLKPGIFLVTFVSYVYIENPKIPFL